MPAIMVFAYKCDANSVSNLFLFGYLAMAAAAPLGIGGAVPSGFPLQEKARIYCISDLSRDQHQISSGHCYC